MDSGTLALIISPAAIVVTALITNWVGRRNSQDITEITRFETLLNGQGTRIQTLEDEVQELKDKRTADRAEISRLRQIVRAWFDQLRTAWGEHPTPMPMPPDDDLDFLGLTHPSRPPK
jgi:hypothetical protein